MDYQFSYKLPDGLQARPNQEHPVGTSAAKQAMLEGRPAPNVRPAATAPSSPPTTPKPRAYRLVIAGSAAAMAAAAAWYMLPVTQPDATAAPGAHPIRATPSQAPAPVTAPNPPQPSTHSVEAHANSQGHADPAPTQTGQMVDPAAGPNAYVPAPTAQGEPPTPTASQTHQRGHYAPQTPYSASHAESAANVRPLAAPASDRYVEADEESAAAVEQERPRTRWRASRSDNGAEQRRPARAEPRAVPRQATEARGAAKNSDRQRLF